AEDARRFTEARRIRGPASTVVTDTDFLGTLTYVQGLASEIDPRWNVLPRLLERVRSELAQGTWGVADRYFYLVLAPDQALARATSAPATHPEPLRDRHQRVGQSERRFFLRRLPLLLPGRVEAVPARGTTEEIARLIQARLTRPCPAPTPGETGKVLAWFERGGK
ncbi:MAG: hypothetical protein L3J97_05280, partial [Thermoplasmata archaeon]|nr:hypothetical protein [Thermoplasmata archaeon]